MKLTIKFNKEESEGFKTWAEVIKPANLDQDDFIFLTGSEYMKPLLKYIKHYETPMAGKRMGERLQWLNQQIAKLHEVIKHIKKLIYEHLPKEIKRMSSIIS